MRHHVIHKQRPCLVAVQESPPPFGLGVGHGDAHAVRIGISAQHQLGIDCFGQFDGFRERRPFFGVGAVNGRKVAVGMPLAFHDVHIAETSRFERWYDGDRAGAMQWRVHDAEVTSICNQILTQSQIEYRLPIRLVRPVFQ